MANYRPLPKPIQTQIHCAIQFAKQIKYWQTIEDIYTSPIQNTIVKISGDLVIDDYQQFEAFLLTFNQNRQIQHHLFFEDYSLDNHEFLNQLFIDLFALIKNETLDLTNQTTGLKIINLDVRQII